MTATMTSLIQQHEIAKLTRSAADAEVRNLTSRITTLLEAGFTKTDVQEVTDELAAAQIAAGAASLKVKELTRELRRQRAAR